MCLALVTAIGWRDTYFYVGIAGLCNSILILTIKEPVRGRFDELHTSNMNSVCSSIWKSSTFSCTHPVLKWMLFACAVRVSAGYIIAFFFVTFATDVFPDNTSIFAYIQAAIVLVSGSLSQIIGGYLANSL